MKITPSVIVRPEFALQIRHQLPERLPFFRHDIRQQQRVEHTVAFRQKSSVTNAARFFAPNQYFALHHQIGNVFKADRSFVELSSVLGRDAIHHAGSVKRAHHIPRPLFVLQQPMQQHAHAFVRIDKAAVFGHRSYAVGIAVGDQARMTFFLDHNFLQHRDMRKDRFRINPRKQRVHFLTNGHVADIVCVEYFWENAPPGAVHRVDGKFEICLANQIEVGKLGNGGDIGGLQINFFDSSGCSILPRFLRKGSSRRHDQLFFDQLHDRGRGRASEFGFEFHAIPVPRIVTRGNHHSASCA